MTIDEMKPTLSVLTGENDDNLLLACLQLARDRILAKCYPFDSTKTEVPARYQSTLMEIAVYLVNKHGAEGEKAHNENGVNITYDSASVPDSMLNNVVPFAKAF